MGNEKKKTLILGVLVVMVLGIGAWQFMGSGPEPTQKKPDAQTTAESTEPTTNASENLSAENDPSMFGLKRKNPFQPYKLPQDASIPGSQNTIIKPPEQNNPSSVRRPSGPRLSPQYGGGMAPYPIDAPGAGPNANVQVNPGAPMRSPNEFAYTLSGVVDGPNPVAVFVSDSGQQKMVPLNGSVEPGSRVVGIRDGKVVVSHKGKTITLRVGGRS